jgi:aminoglycoside/choline kinase family phosphotransferase
MVSDTEAATDVRREALKSWLSQDLGLLCTRVAPASADASFRRYFRVHEGERSLIVMDAPPERENLTPFIVAARALRDMGVTVPEVLEADHERGFLLLTDLGSTHYLAALADRSKGPALYRGATESLIKIQVRGQQAAASLASYDANELDRELQLLPEWFVTRHLQAQLSPADSALIARHSIKLSDAALEQPQVYVHRDYHSRNLMLATDGGPGILDFQDAIRGALTYDLVSLFKDCYIEWPRAQVLEWIMDYRRRLERQGLLLKADQAEFVRWFDWMGLQRHLKVLGIFSRLWYRDGKIAYLKDLPLVLRYVLETTAVYSELSELHGWLTDLASERFAGAQARVLA